MPTTTIRPGVTLWFDERGPADTPPLLLVMGAASSGLVWPEAFVDRLAERHRVIRYDHRDTGASTHAFAEQPYALRDLADDAALLLDALGIADAHVVGMSMGGTRRTPHTRSLTRSSRSRTRLIRADAPCRAHAPEGPETLTLL